MKDPGDEESETRTLDVLGAERRKKREILADQGIDPYPARFDRTATAAELRARYGDLDADVRTGETVRMAGRLTSIRGHGRLSFATLADSNTRRTSETRHMATLRLRSGVTLRDFIEREGEGS